MRDYWIRLLARGEPTGMETLNGFLMALWGLWLVMPWETYQASGVWRIMASVGPEWVFGLGAFLLGVWRLWACVKGSTTQRRYLSMLTCMAWLFVAILFVFSDYRATGTVIYPVLAMSSALAYLRLRGETNAK